MKTDKSLKDYIMLVGLPGSGKSTYSLATFPNHVYLSSDSIIENMATTVNKTYNEVFDATIGPAQTIVDAQLELASFAKEDIVHDQTNLTIRSRMRKLNMLKNKDKYWKVAIIFDTPEDLLFLRLSKRAESGKIISKSLMKRMSASYEAPTVEEGFDEIKIISV